MKFIHILFNSSSEFNGFCPIFAAKQDLPAMQVTSSLCKFSHHRDVIMRIVIREAGISRYHGGQIDGLSETPRSSQHYGIERFKGEPYPR